MLRKFGAVVIWPFLFALTCCIIILCLAHRVVPSDEYYKEKP
jgi:hypothetical protein